MTQEQEWEKWRTQESKFLGESIAWAVDVFQTTDAGIEERRLYGAALLAHSIECARAIRLCVERDLAGPAFSLARVQYEAALRGHIIIHEIDLEELGKFLDQIRRWQGTEQPTERPPTIIVSGTKWKCSENRTKRAWRSLQSEIAKSFADSIHNKGVMHDLTHSGMTHALQMRNEDGNIGPSYLLENQVRLLHFANSGVMFVIGTWPGVIQKYPQEIGDRLDALLQLRSMWDLQIQNPTA